MSTVMCVKFKQELEALSKPPLLGKLGIEVQSKLSAKGWELWKTVQTILINEAGVSMMNPSGINFALRNLEQFLENDEIETTMIGKLLKQNAELPQDLIDQAIASGIITGQEGNDEVTTEEVSEEHSKGETETSTQADEVPDDSGMMFYEVK
ncbi:Fe(2+)-trafficking protein [Vibrio splendidus]|nr:Fe(2+)-trafficking protein [Vibrio splendidus]MCC4880370.1 Fe(2+)-trafficking protein [Vibrio splendidus]